MKKRILSMLLVLCMCFAMLTVTAQAAGTIASGSWGANTNWSISTDGTLTITGTRHMDGSSTQIFPWHDYSDKITAIVVEGHTTIADYAFSYLENVTRVTLGDSLVTIGSNVFRDCTALKSVTIPASVESIGAGAFYYCTSLAAVSFEKGSALTQLGESVFQETAIKSIVIPEGVTAIPDYAFVSCTSLASVTLPEGLISFGTRCFFNCTALTSMVIPANLQRFTHAEAFMYCTNLTHLELYSNVDYSYEFPDCPITDVVVHDNLTEFTGFDGCATLARVTLPDTIEVIGNDAFNGCTSLTDIEWPANLKTIGTWAFAKTGLTDVAIPDSVTSVGNSAFRECKDLESFTFGSNVDELPYCLLSGCTSLKSADLGNATEMGFEAFDGCTALTDVTMSEKLAYMDYYGFHNCTALKRIDIPASLTKMNHSIFFGCTGLKEVFFHGSAPAIGAHTFKNVKATAYYPVNDNTWTEAVMQDYGGTITWEARSCMEGCVYASEPVEPTCTAPGGTRYTCTVCGYSYVDETVPAKGHDYQPTETIAPTCTEAGYTVFTCAVCGETTTGDEVAALGHDFQDGVCTVCGVSLSSPAVTASNVASSGKIQLTWDAVPGAAKYKVYRSASEDGTYKLILTTAKTSFTNTSVKTGDTYYYYVVAVGEDGFLSAPSATVRGICKLPRTTVTASNVASSGKIKLSWNAVEGAVKYEVYRADSKNGTYTKVFTTTKTSYTNTSAVAANRYYYKVVAVGDDPAVSSAPSSVISRLCDLARPTLTLSSVASSGKIKLTWKTITGAAGYKIYRSTDGENWKLIKTIKDPSDKDFINTSIDAGTKYYYRIKAIATDSNADSAYSTAKSRTCDLARPDVQVALNSKGKPSLSWEAVPGAVEYKVYRADSRDGTYKLIKTTDKTSFVNTSVPSYETYYYKVTAVAANTAANSAKSLAVGVSASSTDIYTGQLSQDFVSRINDYRLYYGIPMLEWHTDGEIAALTRAAEYTISFSENRPDGSSTEEMMEAYGIAFEAGLQSDMEAMDIVDVLMYYEEYADFAAIFMYEEWTYAAVACNDGNWCILFG